MIVTVTINPDGTAKQLETANGVCLVPDGVLARASHVEPAKPLYRVMFHALRAVFGESGLVADWTRKYPCDWRVNLSPVAGPILPELFRDRQAAINREIDWLNENFL